MSADGAFAAACAAAEKVHDRECKCGTKYHLAGRNGPNLVMLMAAMHVAEAVTRELDGKGTMDDVLKCVETYRAKRRAF